MLSWHVLGASVSGTSHRRTGRGCDDAHAYRAYGNDLVLLAAADGAGSAAWSALGASIAVQVALDTAERILLSQAEPVQNNEWNAILEFIVTTVHDALATHITNSIPALPVDVFANSATQIALPSSLHDLATTLLVAIVTTNWLAVVQVGDGAIVKQRADGIVISLTPRSEQQHLDATNFVTDSAYLQYCTYVIQSRADTVGIALLTDGLQMIAMHFPENIPHQPFFAPLFKFAAKAEANERELQHFLESERICNRTDDDKTLLLAVYQ